MQNPFTNDAFAPPRLYFPLAASVALAAIGSVKFLWFHAIAEMFSIAVGMSLYVVASLSYRVGRNHFLLFLAQGFFWAAFLDGCHTLLYPGTGIVPGDSPDPAVQLWLCARFVQAATLLVAPGFLSGRPTPSWTMAAFGTASLACVALVLAGAFPDAYVPGSGLTRLKIVTEYVLIGMLCFAAYRFHRHPADAESRHLRAVMFGIIGLTMASEYAFTVYSDLTSASIIIGHILKFWAFWLVLSAVGHWMLEKPIRLMARAAGSFDAIPAPVLTLDGAGIVLSCNESARRMHPGGGVGRHLHDTWHSPAALREECPVCHAIEDGRPISTVLYDGERNEWSGIRLYPINPDDSSLGYVCFHTDITERKHAEERRAQTEKLELIGRMASGLAHDLNNLMGMVLGSLCLLGARIPDDAKAKKHYGLAMDSTQRAVDVARSLLAVARKQTLVPTTVDVRTAIGELLPLLRESAGPAIDVKEVYCDTCPTADRCAHCMLATVDAAGLANAILNLVINARDAMPGGGRIVIRSEIRTVGRHHLGVPNNLDVGRYIVVSVSDDGAGMTPQVAAKAFEPFFTTKEPGKGTGLGLTTIYGFARESHGTVTLCTRRGVGTTISLYIPAVNDSPLAPEAPPPRGNGERVLLVDDDATLATVAGKWLQCLGYRVEIATPSHDAMTILREHAIDLLITDVAAVDGDGLPREALSRHPALRILLATGLCAELLATDQGWPTLEKPYRKSDLARAVRQALEKRPAVTPQPPTTGAIP